MDNKQLQLNIPEDKNVTINTVVKAVKEGAHILVQGALTNALGVKYFDNKKNIKMYVKWFNDNLCIVLPNIGKRLVRRKDDNT